MPESMPMPTNEPKIVTSPLAESVRLPEQGPKTDVAPMSFDEADTLKDTDTLKEPDTLKDRPPEMTERNA